MQVYNGKFPLCAILCAFGHLSRVSLSLGPEDAGCMQNLLCFLIFIYQDKNHVCQSYWLIICVADLPCDLVEEFNKKTKTKIVCECCWRPTNISFILFYS